MRRILRDNGLSIILSALFLIFLIATSLTGQHEYNQDQQEHGQPAVGYFEYLGKGHFAEAVFENWESEFLQMGAFVLLTAFLYQKGSAESKEPGTVEAVDLVPEHASSDKDAPAPLRYGFLIQKLYENSLGLAFIALFIFSFALHAIGGAKAYNQEQMEHGAEQVSTIEYMETSRFWFESFQNWQSEFLAVLSMVVLTIFLRQRGSPESKPVYSAHDETGK